MFDYLFCFNTVFFFQRIIFVWKVQWQKKRDTKRKRSSLNVQNSSLQYGAYSGISQKASIKTLFLNSSCLPISQSIRISGNCACTYVYICSLWMYIFVCICMCFEQNIALKNSSDCGILKRFIWKAKQQRERESRVSKRTHFSASVYWFNPQMATASRPGLGWSQEPRKASWSPTWVARDPTYCLSTRISKKLDQEQRCQESHWYFYIGMQAL